MASTLLRADGRVEQLQPANGSHWTLEELQTLVGGYIEVVQTRDAKFLVLDEEGKLKGKPRNIAATALYRFGTHDSVVGDVVLVETLAEMNGPEDADEE